MVPIIFYIAHCCSVWFWTTIMSDSLPPLDCSSPGLPVPHHLSEFAQVHVHFISDAIQPSRPMMRSSPSVLNHSQHQGLFQCGQMFVSGDQNTGASASSSVLPMNIQGWSPLRLTGLISSLSKGLSGVFSSTTVQRHRFFGAPHLLYCPVHNRMWPMEDRSVEYTDLCQQSNVSAFQLPV